MKTLEVWEALRVWELWIAGVLEDLWNGEKWFPWMPYIEGGSWVGVILPKIQEEISTVGSTSHHWMRGTNCSLEQLMMHRGLRSVSSIYGICKIVISHMWTKEMNGFNSKKSKPHFFSSDRREKPEFLGAIVEVRPQNCILGLEFCSKMLIGSRTNEQ